MIVFRGTEYTREDCRDAIDSAVARIINRKVDIVGIICRRTPELLFLMERLYEVGITFVPIDPDCPVSRRDYILRTAGVEWIIMQRGIADNLGDKHVIYIDEAPAVKCIARDYSVEGNKAAYILFTSGSTGNPKGVEISREALKSFFDSIGCAVDFSESKRIACLTTVMFDIFILESLYALRTGLSIALGDEKEQTNPKAIADLIKENNVDTVQMTPSRLQMVLNYDETLDCMKNVRVIMVGGEALSETILKKLQMYTDAAIYNMYGPTEATIWCGVSNLTHKKTVDIGKAISNAEMMILGEDLTPVSYGETGEICVAGSVLATRYVGEEELTSKAFVYLKGEQGKRIYKTGDMGYFLPDGCIRYVGRKYNQVKVHGYRIELEEIEVCANGYDGIERTLAYYDAERSEGIKLYYVGEDACDVNGLTLYLESKLPHYMIPTSYYRVEKFLYTPNGKVDRKRVKECKMLAEYEAPSYDTYSQIVDEIHKDVKETVSDYLKEKVDITVEYETGLERLGIDSLTFIKLIVFLEEKYGFMFDDDKLIVTAFPSVYDLGDYIKAKTENA